MRHHFCPGFLSAGRRRYWAFCPPKRGLVPGLGMEASPISPAHPAAAQRDHRTDGHVLAQLEVRDVLAGLLGSMLASWQPDSEKSVMEVLALGIEAHGKAARAASKIGLPVTALDILQELPAVLKSN